MQSRLSRGIKEAKWLLVGGAVWSTGHPAACVGSPSKLTRNGWTRTLHFSEATRPASMSATRERASDDSTVHISTSRSSPRQHEGWAAVNRAQPRPPSFVSPHFNRLIGRSTSPWRRGTRRHERDGAANKSMSSKTLPPRESRVKPNPTSPQDSGTDCPRSRPRVVPCENSTGGIRLDPCQSPPSRLCPRRILSALQDGVVQIFATFEG